MVEDGEGVDDLAEVLEVAEGDSEVDDSEGAGQVENGN